MNFLCPACRTPLPQSPAGALVDCSQCGVQVDLTRVETSPGMARLSPEVDLTGETLGGYRLLKRLAAGGMGIVYEAQGPNGRCAVKVLSAMLAADPELRARFRREAQALRALEHPGVVRIEAEGEERGFCWYAMEHVEGADLRRALQGGPLAPAVVTGLARRLLEAVGAVHARGLTHRDIKPGNILLAASGPKLCDFGIARFDGSTTLTESAAVLGSLRYMAPEQRLGKAAPSSDLYAVGVVLHEALSGGVPGETELPRATPRRLRRLVRRLLEQAPLERPRNAAAAAALLDPVPARTWAWGAVSVAALALFWIQFAPFGRSEDSAPVQKMTGEATPVEAKAPPVEAPQQAAVAPAGQRGEGSSSDIMGNAPAVQANAASSAQDGANVFGTAPAGKSSNGLGALGKLGTREPEPQPTLGAVEQTPRVGGGAVVEEQKGRKARIPSTKSAPSKPKQAAAPRPSLTDEERKDLDARLEDLGIDNPKERMSLLKKLESVPAAKREALLLEFAPKLPSKEAPPPPKRIPAK